MTAHAAKSVRLLVAEDNPLVRDLIQKGALIRMRSGYRRRTVATRCER